MDSDRKVVIRGLNPDSAVKLRSRKRKGESWSNEGVRLRSFKVILRFGAWSLSDGTDRHSTADGRLLRGNTLSTSLRKGFTLRSLSNATAESGLNSSKRLK